MENSVQGPHAMLRGLTVAPIGFIQPICMVSYFRCQTLSLPVTQEIFVTQEILKGNHDCAGMRADTLLVPSYGKMRADAHISRILLIEHKIKPFSSPNERRFRRIHSKQAVKEDKEQRNKQARTVTEVSERKEIPLFL